MTIEEALDQVTRVAGVRAAVVCDYDGLHIASRSAVGAAEEERVAAMAAEIGRSASKLLRSADGDQLQMAMFGAANGNLVMADAARGFLVALTDQAANTGLLRMAVERAAASLSGELGRTAADEEEGAESPEKPDEPSRGTTAKDAPA